MNTAAGSLHTVPESPPPSPALLAVDQGVADALESVLSDNTRRVYAAQWRLFTGWCDSVDLVAALSDAGLRRSEAAALTWGDVQRWDDGSGRITVIRSKTDVDAQGAVVAITPAAMKALDALRPVGVGGEEKVFGLSESQIARRVKVIAKAFGLTDWEFFSGHSGRVGMARRMAQNGAPTHEIERQGRWKQGGGMVGRYTRGESAGSALRYL